MAERDDIDRTERGQSTYDPEKEIPDPEQVEKDRQEAERIYGNQQVKKPAA